MMRSTSLVLIQCALRSRARRDPPLRGACYAEGPAALDHPLGQGLERSTRRGVLGAVERRVEEAWKRLQGSRSTAGRAERDGCLRSPAMKRWERGKPRTSEPPEGNSRPSGQGRGRRRRGGSSYRRPTGMLPEGESSRSARASNTSAGLRRGRYCLLRLR